MNAEPPRRRRPIQATAEPESEPESEPGGPPLPPAPTVMPEGVAAITHESEASSGATRRRIYRRAEPRQPRAVQAIAALGLVLITAGAVGGLGYAVILNGDPAAVTTLGVIASGGVGALATIVGARMGGGGNASNGASDEG